MNYIGELESVASELYDTPFYGIGYSWTLAVSYTMFLWQIWFIYIHIIMCTQTKVCHFYAALLTQSLNTHEWSWYHVPLFGDFQSRAN